MAHEDDIIITLYACFCSFSFAIIIVVRVMGKVCWIIFIVIHRIKHPLSVRERTRIHLMVSLGDIVQFRRSICERSCINYYTTFFSKELFRIIGSHVLKSICAIDDYMDRFSAINAVFAHYPYFFCYWVIREKHCTTIEPFETF